MKAMRSSGGLAGAAIESTEAKDADTAEICADEIWLWAHAWEGPGCLGPHYHSQRLLAYVR
jgi:hypothetical protein